MTTRSTGRLLAKAAALAFVLVALSGCDVMVGLGDFGGREQVKDQWTRSYPLSGGGQLEIVNVNGSIVTDGIRLETTNGGIHLTLPASAKAEIRASCMNGSVKADNLAFEHRGTQSRRRLDATLNGGGARIDLGTTNGGIKLTGK